ncbi:MAG: hypothetical protein GY863_01275 [bacterium]|nr:hypothetical protein [bacterium]
MDKRRFIISTLLAWLIFIMIDFIWHASLLAEFWLEDHAALKPLKDLAYLIPAGYLSFLLLTFLAGGVFLKIYSENPGFKKALTFGALFGGLFSASNIIGLYSYVELPILFLFLTNLAYFIEITAAVLVIRYIYFAELIRKKLICILSIFFTGMVFGIILQNILNAY